MSEENKKKRLKGFAKMLNAGLQQMLANDSVKEKFEEMNKNKDLCVLLNPTDGRYAALIKIKNSKLEIDAIRNKEENLKQEDLNWEGKVETTTDLFLKIAMGDLSTAKIIWKWITRKIKVKNYKKVLEAFSAFM